MNFTACPTCKRPTLTSVVGNCYLCGLAKPIHSVYSKDHEQEVPAREEDMGRVKAFIATTIIAAALLMLTGACAPVVQDIPAPAVVYGDGNRCQDGAQREAIVGTAEQSITQGRQWESSDVFVSDMYYSQCIDLPYDRDGIMEATYLPETMQSGDIVIGDGYAGIVAGDGRAVVVDDAGSLAYAVTLTDEDVRRVDW